MHLGHQHLLIIRTIENADISPLGQAAVDAPQIIVVELLRGRLFEAVHLHPLGIEAAHHMLDRAVLPGRIHRLEDQQQGVPVLGIKAVLQFRHFLDVFLEQGQPLVFAQSAVLAGVEGGDGKPALFRHAIWIRVHWNPPLFSGLAVLLLYAGPSGSIRARRRSGPHGTLSPAGIS